MAISPQYKNKQNFRYELLTKMKILYIECNGKNVDGWLKFKWPRVLDFKWRRNNRIYLEENRNRRECKQIYWTISPWSFSMFRHCCRVIWNARRMQLKKTVMFTKYSRFCTIKKKTKPCLRIFWKKISYIESLCVEIVHNYNNKGS